MKHLSTVLVILAALALTASGLAQEEPSDPPPAEDEQPGEEQQNEIRTEFTLEVHSNGEVYFQLADENDQQDEQDQQDQQDQQNEQDQQDQQDQQDEQDQQDQQDRNPELRVPADTEITITLWGVGPQEHNIVVNGEASDFVADGEETTFTFTSGEAGAQMEYHSENDEMARGSIHVEEMEEEAPPEDPDDPFVPEDPGEPAPEDDDAETPAPGIIAVIGVFALAALLYKRRK